MLSTVKPNQNDGAILGVNTYAGGDRRWKFPRCGYASSNHVGRDTAKEKNSVEDSRTRK
jgi:hypothetical protein